MERNLEFEARRLASQLTLDDLATSLWYEFLDAVACAQDDDWDSVSTWVDENENRLVNRYETFVAEGYAEPDPELGPYASACQKLLLEGVEQWLEALEMMRSNPTSPEVMEKAELGQRYLIAVQRLENTDSQPGETLQVWGY